MSYLVKHLKEVAFFIIVGKLLIFILPLNLICHSQKGYYITDSRFYYIIGFLLKWTIIDFISLHYGQLIFCIVSDPFEELSNCSCFPGTQSSSGFLTKNWIFAPLSAMFSAMTHPRLACGHSHVPRRSSRKPICSLRESMRSSCWKEWDSKVVFSDQPSSSDSGKKLLKGANTNCNFCTEGER